MTDDKFEAIGFAVYEADRFVCTTAPTTPATAFEAGQAKGTAERIAVILSASAWMPLDEIVRRLKSKD